MKDGELETLEPKFILNITRRVLTEKFNYETPPIVGVGSVVYYYLNNKDYRLVKIEKIQQITEQLYVPFNIVDIMAFTRNNFYIKEVDGYNYIVCNVYFFEAEHTARFEGDFDVFERERK